MNLHDFRENLKVNIDFIGDGVDFFNYWIELQGIYMHQGFHFENKIEECIEGLREIANQLE